MYTTAAQRGTVGEVLAREFKPLALTPKTRLIDYAELAA